MSGTVHIYAPPATLLCIQVVPRRCRTWREFRDGGAPASIPEARRRAALALADNPWVRKVRVVASYEWHDPSVVFEAHKR